MIDLETLGQIPGSAIVSIGCYELETERTFYEEITLASNFAAKLTICASTIEWWMKQSDEARAVFNSPNRVMLNVALLKLSNWLQKSGSFQPWGNGANFDLTLLECAYRACKLEIPWKYTSVRCYRTLKAEFRHIKAVRSGVAHNALDDAKVQGIHLKAILDSNRS